MDNRWTSSTTHGSGMLDLPAPLAVVCHDAGAANQILPWLKAWGGPVRAHMAGPAAQLWAAQFPGQSLLPGLEDALDGAACLLSGTGWASDLEHRARVLAGQRGLRSIAVLDHWVNYLPRFERSGQRQWPDELWVTDAHAQALAAGIFDPLPVRRLPSLYAQQQVARIGPPPGRHRLLYMLEPVRDDWGRGTPGEFQALDYALARLHLLAPAPEVTLTLRPHPSQQADSFRCFAERHPGIRFDQSADVASAIADADIVLGVESYALTLALQAGRRVFSTLPPWAPPLRLPHPDIIQIRHLPQP